MAIIHHVRPTEDNYLGTVKFFGQTLAVIVVSVGVSATLLRLTDTRQPTISFAPPIALKTLLTGPLGTILFLRQYTDKVLMDILQWQRETCTLFVGDL